MWLHQNCAKEAIHALPDHFASLFRKLNPSVSFEVKASSQYNSIKAVDRARGTVTGARNLSRVSNSWKNLIADRVRRAKADFQLVPCARIKAWLRYWRSLAWWQGLSKLMAL